MSSTNDLVQFTESAGIFNTVSKQASTSCALSISMKINIPKIEPEETPAKVQQCVAPPSGWPTKGTIRFDQASLRHRPELNLLFDRFRFQSMLVKKWLWQSNRIRKEYDPSSFTVVEYENGTIEIVRVATKTVPLATLRSQVAVLPRHSVLFGGTVRFNLDPSGEYSDEALWRALEKANIRFFPLRLDEILDDCGSNFRRGEKQLFCLALVLLGLDKVKILLLDEATASVDHETDAFVQERSQKDFTHCTILTIAHRLETIMNNDRVVVLCAGQVVEEGPPRDKKRVNFVHSQVIKGYQLIAYGENYHQSKDQQEKRK